MKITAEHVKCINAGLEMLRIETTSLWLRDRAYILEKENKKLQEDYGNLVSNMAELSRKLHLSLSQPVKFNKDELNVLKLLKDVFKKKLDMYSLISERVIKESDRQENFVNSMTQEWLEIVEIEKIILENINKNQN